MDNIPDHSNCSTPSTSTAADSESVRTDQIRHVHLMYPPVGYFPYPFPMYNVPARFPVAPTPAFTPYQLGNSTIPPLPVYTPPVESMQATPFDQSFDERLVGVNEPIALSQLLAGDSEWQNYPTEVTTEDFCQFLEHGCIIAQQIAKKNRHRPCFKNIENLCNRMRNELVKPDNTAANIYSQGLPWATKDFIYAYIRLVNCWYMLKNYVDFDPRTLGNVELELTSEFQNAFKFWEEDTKILTSHMIRIFTKLNDSVVQQAPPNTDTQPSTSKANNWDVKPEEEMKKNVQSEKSSSSSHHLLQNTEPVEPYYMMPFKQPKADEKSEQNILESLFSWKVPELSTSAIRGAPTPAIENAETQSVVFIPPENSLPGKPETTCLTATTSELLWEQESGGLTPFGMEVLEEILNLMDNDNLNKWLSFARDLDTYQVPTTISMIREKLNANRYEYVNQFMFDFKRLLANSLKYHKLQGNAEGIEQLRYHEIRFSNIINSEFADFDFSHVGGHFPNLGHLVRK